MPRVKPIVIFGLVALLAAVAALGVFANGTSRTAASNGAELTVPGTYAKNASFKAAPATGAASRVELGFPNIRVNTDQTNEAQNEPFVAVNPSNPSHIVVGANNWEAGNGRYEVTAYVSFDRGHTWAASHPYIERNASRVNAADPTVAFGADGKVYFGFVAMSPAQGAVAVSTSLDGGLSWSSQSWATSFATAADKPAIATSPNGRIYVYYQNSALQSTYTANGGASWSAATTVEVGGRNAAPMVDRSGNIYVAYNTANAIKVAYINTSSTGRNTYSISKVADAVALYNRPTAYRAGIYPAAGMSASGTLYVAWADGRNGAAGHGNDIMFSRSSDGKHWSAATVVNTDSGNADQLMPSLSVGRDGAVNIAWLDTRNDSANVNYDVYMARSTDGVNFGANMRVSSQSSNPNNDPRTGGALIGDYFALAAGEGEVYSVWTDTRNNNEDIYLAPVPFSSSK